MVHLLGRRAEPLDRCAAPSGAPLLRFGDGAAPTPILVSVDDFADNANVEKYEGVLITIEGVTVTGTYTYGFDLGDNLSANNRIWAGLTEYGAGETDTFSAALLCEVLVDDNYGAHVPGPYSRKGALVRQGGSFV